MDKEQGLLKRCPFCGGEAHLQENGATGNRYWEVACYEPCDFCGPSHDTREEAIAAWNRRSSSDEQRAEVVAKPTHYRDAPADLKEKAREIVETFGAGDGNNALMEGAICAALVDERWLSPAVAMGGVTEAQIEEVWKRIDGMAYVTIDDVRSILTAALAVRDEGMREGWQPIIDAVRGPVTVCRFGDAEHNWLPMTAYRVSGGRWERPASRDGLPYEPTHWQPLPTPILKGEGE